MVAPISAAVAAAVKRDIDTRRSLEERSFAEPLVHPGAAPSGSRHRPNVEYVWGLLRLGMGWIFIWGFLDKLFGLGYATQSDAAWINGGSPTLGFLQFGTKGPFAEFYQGIAGNVVVDWLFMLGLLAIGLPLMLGIGVRLAGYAGIAMLALMYSAGFILPENNPFLDEHIIYALIIIGLTLVPAGRWLGLGKWWSETRLVRSYRVLQ